jgi:surface antigen
MLKLAVGTAALFIGLATPLAHADPDKDESGHGRGHRHGHGHGHGHDHKEEFWDGDCKVERKWKKDGEYKEERKCKGSGHRHVHAPAVQPVMVYPPWIVMQQGERAYDPRYRPRPVSSASNCNSDTVGKVLGGLVGGALGSQIGKGTGRAVATVGGAVAGVLIGGEVGRRMDARDQACVGQVLEVAPVNQRVQWAEGSTQYAVVPGQVVDRQGSYCRPYTMELRLDGQVQRSNGIACRRGDGTWAAAS